MVSLAPRITRHGVLVDIYGEGMLIIVESGVGKISATFTKYEASCHTAIQKSSMAAFFKILVTIA
jgi:hypothetical protein